MWQFLQLFTLDMFKHSIPGEKKNSRIEQQQKNLKLAELAKKEMKILPQNVSPLCVFLKTCQRNQHSYLQKETAMEHSLFNSIFHSESSTIKSLDNIFSAFFPPPNIVFVLLWWCFILCLMVRWKRLMKLALLTKCLSWGLQLAVVHLNFLCSFSHNKSKATLKPLGC